MDAEAEAEARVGAVLNDKWTLERLLGVGGMAAVYEGRHRNGARAAVKVLHRELSRHKEVRERFQREGYAANKVGHPGVVKVLDDDVISGGTDNGTPYLVMELLEGESLQDRLERGPPMGEREFLKVADEVLDVLRSAQEAGVVHRDLKPENLFFANDGAGGAKVKVLDFGLARLLAGQSITTHGLALGTPSFMSPEQAAGRLNEIDARTDLFALAATGFRLRTGRRIHESDDPIDLVMKMARLPAPPIRSIVPDVSEPYARVIDRALEFKREDRYETAAAMREDVQRAIAEIDAGAVAAPARRRPPPPRGAAKEKAAAKPEPAAAPGERNIVRRPAYGIDESVRIPKNSSMILLWIALVVAAGVGLAVWRDPAHGSHLFGAIGAWGRSLGGSEPAAASAQPSSPDASPLAATPASSEAGAPRLAPTRTHSTPPIASATATHHSAPARSGQGGGPSNLPPQH
jgi:serine/threonine-protein kinase